MADAVLLGREPADFRVTAGAQTASEGAPQRETVHAGGVLQRLQVGVGHPEIHALQPGLNHAADRVGSSAAHAQHLEAGG